MDTIGAELNHHWARLEGVTVFRLFPHIETVGQLLLGFPERMLHALFFDTTLVFTYRASSDV